MYTPSCGSAATKAFTAEAHILINLIALRAKLINLIGRRAEADEFQASKTAIPFGCDGNHR